MIASHLLAYFFTELNHDQVQKVSKRAGRGGRLASGKVGAVPGPFPEVPAWILLDFAGTRFFPIPGGGRGKSLGGGETPGHEEPRPLGTRRRVRACEALELAYRTALPPCHSARGRAFFFFWRGGSPESSLRLLSPRGRSPSVSARVPARARGENRGWGRRLRCLVGLLGASSAKGPH